MPGLQIQSLPVAEYDTCATPRRSHPEKLVQGQRAALKHMQGCRGAPGLEPEPTTAHKLGRYTHSLAQGKQLRQSEALAEGARLQAKQISQRSSLQMNTRIRPPLRSYSRAGASAYSLTCFVQNKRPSEGFAPCRLACLQSLCAASA